MEEREKKWAASSWGRRTLKKVAPKSNRWGQIHAGAVLPREAAVLPPHAFQPTNGSQKNPH